MTIDSQQSTIVFGDKTLVAAVVLSMVGTVNIPVTTTAFASIVLDDENDKNDSGEAASEDARDVDEDSETHKGLGEHSRAGSAAGDPPFDSDDEGDDDKPGRFGIGNVGEAVCQSDEKVHPSELARVLTGGDCPE